ncbi:NYN domain-containing protein [Nocardia wallacei]|uniref:NYN domain-containing protein n=1 Tax=Nocardia wallacei TaxID=480035 RepID=UPI002457FDB4|nr:NYN domain-containing protein [Nocardia wallacei]
MLIDAENVPAHRIGTVLAAASDFGAARIRRAYGDWSRPSLAPWRNPMTAYAIRPIHQPSHISGKNAADIALAIDAIDLLHTHGIHTFVLVSSDSDFTGLALRLRESGCRVYGFRESKTPKPFTAACTGFACLDTPTTRTAPTSSPPAPATSQPGTRAARTPLPPKATKKNPLALDAELCNRLRQIVREAADSDGWTNQATLASKAAARIPGFDTKDYGYPKFGKFVVACGLFDICKRSPGPGNRKSPTCVTSPNEPPHQRDRFLSTTSPATPNEFDRWRLPVTTDLGDTLQDPDAVPEWRDVAVELRAGTHRSVPEIHSVEEKLELVGGGEGIAVIPASTAGFYTRPDVEVLPIEDLGPNQVAAAWPAARATALVREFAEAAADLLPESPADRPRRA